MEVDEIRDMYGKCPMAEIHDAYRSIDIENVDPYSSNDTPLHLACTYADYEAIKILLERGADYNAVNNYADTPLHLLAKQDTNHYPTSDGQTRGCANILFLAKVSATPKNDVGRTPIMEAAIAGRYELLEAAVENGIKLTATNRSGDNALHLACYWVRNAIEIQEQQKVDCYFKSVKALLDGGMDADEKNNSGQTPLELAIESGDKRIGALLNGDCGWSNGIEVLTGGMTLHQAVEKADYQAINAHARLNADINATNDVQGVFNGVTPLAIACYMLDVEAVKSLLSLGADPNFKNANGATALTKWFEYRGDQYMTSSKSRDKVAQKIVKELLVAELDIDGTINDKSDTLLIAACKSADKGRQYNDNPTLGLSVAKLLLKADVNLSNIDGQTALMLLCASPSNDSQTSNLQMSLLEVGAIIDATDRHGNTPLHYAAMNEAPNIGKERAETLFEFGNPKPEAVNNAGKSALEIASDTNNEPLVKLILMKS